MSVKDRNLVTTADAERRVVTPAGLQEKIDQAVASVSRYRYRNGFRQLQFYFFEGGGRVTYVSVVCINDAEPLHF